MRLFLAPGEGSQTSREKKHELSATGRQETAQTLELKRSSLGFAKILVV